MSASVLRRELLSLLMAALPSIAAAHRLDECLQSTLVVIEPAEVRLQLNLTPGVEVATRVIAGIDSNRDDAISTEEAAAYGDRLRRDLTITIDGKETALKLTTSRFPKPAELRGGHGIVQIEFRAAMERMKAGEHVLRLTNSHLPDLSVYLFNAAKPQVDGVRISRQSRDPRQSRGEIVFVVDPPSADAR